MLRVNQQSFGRQRIVYERSNGRTCSSLVVALPKELNTAQRIELAEQFIAEFANRYPVIHLLVPFITMWVRLLALTARTYISCIASGMWMASSGTPEQFFKRYNPKNLRKVVPRS